MKQKSQLASLGLFDAKVPRYTSYPTAPHFAGGVNASVFSGWLRDIAPGSQISLYVHVPFCRRLCWFCACRTQGTQSDAPVRAYLDTLKAEIALLKSHLPEGVSLSRLHWGGGTPTLLSADMIRELAAAQADLAPWAPGTKFSVEIDPNECDAARLDALAEAGMNRASIGVQDFDATIQNAIGRLQSYELTHETFEMLRARGIHSINADILFGLPHQTPERITDSAQKLLSLSPDRVALFGYAHVPWMARRQTMIPTDTLPTPENRLDLFDTARRLFLWDGYREIGIDHFARPDDSLVKAQTSGRLKRNFQGYTEDPADVLIGIGASAISRFPQGYAQNAPGTADHAKAIATGQFATARGHVFQGEDKLRGRMIESLMCDFRISAEEILGKFSISTQRLRELLEDTARAFPNMVELSQEGLSIPERARPLTRMIARSLDAYEVNQAGHSSAI
ncbi:oxygen-independent coproporphyrinogen III oxidase [Phaeobacter gallaeciensis]|uniref:oxygen-independent coproporphyrinogen III oxidase n=1 Tax=Phaeobacter TaxID=302485 RepID=UPI00237FD98B|nr:oxygen-independent coproporphyrinogen III oxidase [Phaeobacter gallaeciensis]MDE4273436.1 oxygen-independent coproporphyrinogen III oxidase [Phaeobacter gallaeciensis]MDE4298676.1 oxygen-independent coproporphyrinogen III oxidase [Phaeobacter gallaeciensis]MDE5184113.1 oxygen-independent coproporphyrinogen III oxidase [Phaeobacter gallaeciensis]